MIIYCCGCGVYISARLTDGSEIYPHREDLDSLPFWVCDRCNNYVGCHHKTQDRTNPLGSIPSAVLREKRKAIHAIIDPLWRGGKQSRGSVYAAMQKALGYEFHSAEINTIQQADAAITAAKQLRATLRVE